MINYLYIFPEIIITSALCFIIVLDLFLPNKLKYISYYLIQLSLIFCAYYIYSHISYLTDNNSELYDTSIFSNIFKIFILLSLAMIFYYTSVFLKYFNIFRTEYFLITLFGLLGMMIMISSQNMLLLYLGIELLSLSLYSVIAFNKNSLFSSEAAVKYYILGAISSGFLYPRHFGPNATSFINDSSKYEYSYHFNWLGRPIIQHPQDILALQEIIWEVKPDLIIETGIAHGGSLIFSASILELIGKGQVLGIDIDIRKHNKQEIEKHSMFKRITMIQGSSIDKNIVKKVKKFAENKKKVLLILDSNHSHKHVLKELNSYSSLVTKGSYIIVFDTIIEEIPEKLIQNRPWSAKDNPKTAVRKFLKNDDRFKIDKKIPKKS